MWSLIRKWNSWFPTLYFQVLFNRMFLRNVSAFKNQWRIKKRWIGGSIWPFGHSEWLCIANEISMSACWCSITCSSWYGSYGNLRILPEMNLNFRFWMIWTSSYYKFNCDSPWRSCKTRRHLIALKTPSLHGNNSEFSTKDINLKMSLGIVNGYSYTFHILTVREIHLIIWFTGIIERKKCNTEHIQWWL